MTQIKAVIFDIGNVLIGWQPEKFFDPIIGAERRKEMFAAVDLHGMNDRIDAGANWRDTIMEWADKYPEFKAEINLWHDRWIEMASPVIGQSVLMQRALRAKGIPCFALSNFGIQSFEYAESIYTFLNEFDKRYISGYMGVIKPDPRIYEMVEKDCGFAPENLLFIDDRVDNIDACIKRGWQGHLFDGPEGLADRLVSEGLLTIRETKP